MTFWEGLALGTMLGVEISMFIVAVLMFGEGWVKADQDDWDEDDESEEE